LDRLVEEGVSLDRCYITAPSCVPSRCSIFQGRYPHSAGVYKNGDTWTTSWVSSLADAGYHCVNVGKMHTVPYAAQAGFHERYVVENKDRFLEGRYFFDEWDKALRARGVVKQQRESYRKRPDYRQRMGAFTWDLDEDLQSDNFVGGFADWWLNTYPIEQPLFMQVGFPGPHPPYDPTPDWLERYLHKDLPIRDFSPAEIADQPEAMLALRKHMMEVDHDSVAHVDNPTMEQRRFQRACYLANVSMIDEQVGSILSALEDKGILDDTVVVFTSDHGDSLGDHGHSQKWNMYEEIVHVPAILWFGRNVRGTLGAGLSAPGSRTDALVSTFDLGPTILELAGVEPPAEMEAISLLPLLGAASAGSAAGSSAATSAGTAAGSTTVDAAPASGATVAVGDAHWEIPVGRPLFVTPRDGREYVFAEHGRDNILEGTETMAMVRDKRWKLISYAEADQGQLFDLETDPDERRNLWSDVAAQKEKIRLQEVLSAWYRNSLYHTRTTRRG
jgi:arylsulfatase A-like enzyme